MQNTNLEYRVGYTPLSGRLYAGYVRKDNGKWEGSPHEVTDWAMFAVGQKLAREETDMLFPLPDGRVMRVSAVITDPETTEDANAQR
ncbi:MULTISPECIES: DUF7446 family protein [Pantoea]|uniref:DUF7446 family protein n=1 Tax=Pantoea TaxID=53335 RepID=UPI00141986DC|nr:MULTISPECIES: hypothetical protein [Pantoea]HAT4499313.1 hypothetical protein [Serratia marcescens]MCW0322736.1 hypothetical protein [Pantoea dispersa]MCW0327310.1 hypothetical protein [Pantoea dispersa]MCW0433735.1 hypothetical protein [Pantoea dispersa]NIE53030.1 hypothetical protein [Pantoea sp. Ap-870]